MIKFGETVELEGVKVSLTSVNDGFALTVGEHEIIVRTELESSYDDYGYPATNARELAELEAREEYVIRIWDYSFHGINYRGMCGVDLRKFKKENDNIQFELELIGEKVSLPGQWHSVLGVIKLPENVIE